MQFEFIGDQSVLETTWTWLDDNEKTYNSSDGLDYFDAKCRQLPLCMVEAMKNSDAKGVFGGRQKENDYVLFTGEYDGGEEEDMLASMKTLNPETSYNRYESDFRLFLDI